MPEDLETIYVRLYDKFSLADSDIKSGMAYCFGL